VLKGLRDGEQIVVNGNFLIDSQTRLTGGMTGLFGGSKEFTTQNASHAGNTPAASSLKFSLTTEPDPLKGNGMASFHARLTDAHGAPVTDAQVKLALVMPAMPVMNMPEMRSAGDLHWNGSEYVGQIRIPMSGAWNTTIEASRAGKTVAVEHARLRAE